jgi:curved DNA-binding protein CbpA
MSIIEIDFNTLKFNLYEILNVAPNSSENIIKKSFIRLIKVFHPDKNSALEEEIYYHIILSNQILLNKPSRIKYDKFLETKSETFNELKEDYLKNGRQKNNESNVQTFNDKRMELDAKHGYIEDIATMDKYNKLKSSRNNIEIEKEDIKSNTDFNKKFTDYKSNGKFKNQIVEYDKNSEIMTYTNENYVNLNNMDKLYVNDSISTNTFASLDRAFVLLPLLTETNNKTIKEKINDYKDATQTLMPKTK